MFSFNFDEMKQFPVSPFLSYKKIGYKVKMLQLLNRAYTIPRLSPFLSYKKSNFFEFIMRFCAKPPRRFFSHIWSWRIRPGHKTDNEYTKNEY